MSKYTHRQRSLQALGVGHTKLRTVRKKLLAGGAASSAYRIIRLEGMSGEGRGQVPFPTGQAALVVLTLSKAPPQLAELLMMQS